MPAEMPRKVLLASARFCSQKVRALSRIFPSALKKDLSHSLSCFSDHLCIMRCVCLYLPSRKTACDFEVFEEKRPLALWGLCFYEFAFASSSQAERRSSASIHSLVQQSQYRWRLFLPLFNAFYNVMLLSVAASIIAAQIFGHN